MHYVIETLPDLPVVVSRILPGYDVAEMNVSREEVRKHLDAANQPVFYILDITQTEFNFDAILRASSMGARDQSSVWLHPNIRQVIFISELEVVHRSVAGMDSAAFGNFKAVTFRTFDEALDHIRSEIKVS